MWRSRIWTSIQWGIPLAAGLAMGALAAWWLGRSHPVERETATLLRQVQAMSDLVTVKYIIEKVIDFQDVRWYGENRVLLVAHGIVKAGINLGKLTGNDLKVEGDRIRVQLPRAEITDVYLDESKTQIIEHSTGLLRQFDKDLEQGARQQAVEDIRRAARYSGIYEEARKQARLQLTAFLRQLGFAKVEFVSP